MNITEEKILSIKSKYGHMASWAIRTNKDIKEK